MRHFILGRGLPRPGQARSPGDSVTENQAVFRIVIASYSKFSFHDNLALQPDSASVSPEASGGSTISHLKGGHTVQLPALVEGRTCRHSTGEAARLRGSGLTPGRTPRVLQACGTCPVLLWAHVFGVDPETCLFGKAAFAYYTNFILAVCRLSEVQTQRSGRTLSCRGGGP